VIFYAQAIENTPQAAIEHYQRCVDAALQACLAEGGSISHHHGIGRGKQNWMKEEHGQAGWELLRTLKQAIDPENIFNPGVMDYHEPALSQPPDNSHNLQPLPRPVCFCLPGGRNDLPADWLSFTAGYIGMGT